MIKIREISTEEIYMLKDFLYDAIFIPENEMPPCRSIIEKPELKLYIDNFGDSMHDKCLVSEVEGKLVGAVWSRIMNDYGHIDDNIPSLAISVLKEYRRQGIGTALMIAILELLKHSGYSGASLSVQKANYAVKMYIKLGFEIFSGNDDEYIMLIKF